MSGLVERMAQQDERAIEELFRDTRLSLLGRIRRILPDPHDAEEVLQDVYLQAWRSAGDFRQERGGVSAWLFMIARSRAIDRLRRRQRCPEVKPETTWDWADKNERPDETCLRRSSERAVAHRLRALPAGQRELVELAFYQGWSHSQIAQRKGLPIGTVKTRIRKALGTLKEAF